MSLVVLDASVAAKWFLPAEFEPLSREAAQLFRRFSEGELKFVVPDLFWAEFGNILWKYTRIGRCDSAVASQAVTSLLSCKIGALPTAELLEMAVAIARSFERTVYDSLYIATAIQTKTELITADERLVNALSLHFPVRWLGAL